MDNHGSTGEDPTSEAKGPRILISVDMEGVSGIVHPREAHPDGYDYGRARALMTAEANAAVAGVLDAEPGAEVWVADAHGSYRNLLPEEVDRRARLVRGKPRPLGMLGGIDERTDAVLFVGYHVRAGAGPGVLAHTYLANSLTGVWLDGVRASEGLLNAHVVAEYGVPVVLVTGDDVACEDSKTYAPEAERVAVKDHVSRYAAVCRTPERTAADIRTAARDATRLAVRHEPVQAGPHTVDLEFDAAHLAAAVTVVPGVALTGDLRASYTSETMYEAIRTFKAVTTVAQNAVEETYG